ncbi:predicted protein, partial [Nematostella vectensis]
MCQELPLISRVSSCRPLPPPGSSCRSFLFSPAPYPLRRRGFVLSPLALPSRTLPTPTPWVRVIAPCSSLPHPTPFDAVGSSYRSLLFSPAPYPFRRRGFVLSPLALLSRTLPPPTPWVRLIAPCSSLPHPTPSDAVGSSYRSLLFTPAPYPLRRRGFVLSLLALLSRTLPPPTPWVRLIAPCSSLPHPTPSDAVGSSYRSLLFPPAPYPLRRRGFVLSLLALPSRNLPPPTPWVRLIAPCSSLPQPTPSDAVGSSYRSLLFPPAPYPLRRRGFVLSLLALPSRTLPLPTPWVRVIAPCSSLPHPTPSDAVGSSYRSLLFSPAPYPFRRRGFVLSPLALLSRTLPPPTPWVRIIAPCSSLPHPTSSDAVGSSYRPLLFPPAPYP